jgi:hypothetical protein
MPLKNPAIVLKRQRKVGVANVVRIRQLSENKGVLRRGLAF